jgi:phosphoribosylformylglycinamidine (FGAM) synthase-like enzyme
VSLYNETNGRAIQPTPTIVGVGLLPDWRDMATIAFKSEGDAILLVGGHGDHLGQSLYLRELFGREEGAPPPVDLARERRHGDFARGLIRTHRVTACHDLSDGGLAIALAEMAIAGKIGASVTLGDQAPHIALFAEDQARYLVTTAPENEAAILAEASAAGIPVVRVGLVGGDKLNLGAAGSISIAALRTAHEAWFPAFMGDEFA